MKLLATADLHFTHPRSHKLAVELIERINAMRFDVLLVVGDTGSSEGDELERCLLSFTHGGPKLLVVGNHELWTRNGDSNELLTSLLPQRIRKLGWHWLEGDPFVAGDVAFVGSVGWYDYSFAAEHLGIPKRFYEAKVSPGAAARLSEFEHLVKDATDLGERQLDVVARWNDGRFAHLGRSDEQFLAERLADLERSLEQVKGSPRIIAAVHHLPFAELLPLARNGTWDFVWAYLGAKPIGELLLKYPNVAQVFCGHSHMPMELQVGQVKVTNIGSGYRQKRLVEMEV